MTKKTVVQILRSPAGGIRKHVYDILTGLPGEDYNHVFVTDLSEADAPVPDVPGLVVFDLNIEDRPSIRDLRNLFKIYAFLVLRPVDVIHGHGAKGGLYARCLAFLLRARCIYTPHGGSLHRVYGRVKNFIYDLVELLLVPFTHVYLFESAYSRDTFFRNIVSVPTKAVVNYNGVELPAPPSWTNYTPGSVLRMASFGLLRHLKGHDIVIEACAHLDRMGIPFRYMIYGTGEESEALSKLVAKHHLEDRISFFGYTNAVAEEMKKYDFIVQPSRFESFGYVPVEAMSLGISVISSNEGGLKEVVDESCGFVSVGNTPEEYAEIFRRIYSGEANLAKKVEQAYVKVTGQFSREMMLRKISQIYS